jgi:hypothetical protein
VSRIGNAAFLGFWTAVTLGGCYGFTRDVTPFLLPYAFWWAGLGAFALLNRRLRLLRWPGEFFFWGTSILIIVQLYWLVEHVHGS